MPRHSAGCVGTYVILFFFFLFFFVKIMSESLQMAKNRNRKIKSKKRTVYTTPSTLGEFTGRRRTHNVAFPFHKPMASLWNKCRVEMVESVPDRCPNVVLVRTSLFAMRPRKCCMLYTLNRVSNVFIACK